MSKKLATAKTATGNDASPLGTELTEAIRSWADDNIDASVELLSGDVDECWRALFEKKSKIYSAAEKAEQKKAMAVELVRAHHELAEKLAGRGKSKAKPSKATASADAPTAPPAGPRAIEKVRGHAVHPAAAMFPMMVDTEIQELAQDIKDHGQRVPAIEYKGQILDGRNRIEACGIAGVDPVIVQWDERGGSPAAFVVSVNLMRRHLNESQRGMLAADLLPLFEAEGKERQLAGVKSPVVAAADLGAPVRQGPPKRAPKSSERAGAAANVGARTVEGAKSLKAKSPELADKVRAGEVTIKEAHRQLKHTEQVAAVRTYVPPEGTYSVIVVDFPWPFESRNEDATHRGRLTYPPMAIDDIIAMDVGSLGADDCVMFMWVTNTHAFDGSVDAVVRSLRPHGFTPKTGHTWIKTTSEAETEAELAETSGQYGTGNWGRGGTEHCIVLVKGQPVVDFKKQLNWFAAPRRQHSRKPELFYQRVEEACPAPAKLELFARERRSGWVCSGAEVDEFEDDKATAAIAAAPRAPAAPEPEDDGEPLFEKNRKLALATSFERDRGIVAHRDWGGGFDALLNSLDRGDKIFVRKGSFSGPVIVAGWGKAKLKQRIACTLGGEMRTYDREEIEEIQSVSTRPIEALSAGVKNIILAWAREHLGAPLPKGTAEHPSTVECWRSMVESGIALQVNQRPAVDVQLHAAHKRVLAELETARETEAARKAG